VEYADGRNCAVAADMICDTPPDYGFTSSRGCDCCEMIYDVWDRNGDKIEPMVNNVMAYSKGCNERIFTDLQVAAMITDYESPRRARLRNNVSANEYQPIVDDPELLSPVAAETVEFYDNVLLEWEPVLHAESYVIKISISGTLLEYNSNETELLLTDLKPNSIYIWSCLPLNKFGACLEPIESYFFTGEGSTLTKDLENIQHIEIYPNPIGREGQLYIRDANNSSSEAAIKIINVRGKVIHESRIYLNGNTVQLNAELNAIESGVYYISVQIDKIKTVKKIAVN